MTGAGYDVNEEEEDNSLGKKIKDSLLSSKKKEFSVVNKVGRKFLRVCVCMCLKQFSGINNQWLCEMKNQKVQ